MLSVGKFIIVLLSVILVVLIGCFTQYVIADHTEPGDGIYKDFTDVNLTITQDSKWRVNLQLILRTSDGQLINVTESATNAAFIQIGRAHV